MEKRELTCIGCPMGCAPDGGAGRWRGGVGARQHLPAGDALRPQGSDGPHPHRDHDGACDRRRVGRRELQDPRRYPEGQDFDIIRALKAVEVAAPVVIGQVILPNAADTGVDVIATKNVEKRG